jgi:type I restriction enzyme M protein
MISILDLKNGDSIFDPAVGLGGFYTEASRQIRSRDFYFFGQETNKVIHSFGRMNLLMNGIYNAKILPEDSLVSQNNISIMKGIGKKFDKAISHFPFNQMISRKYEYGTFNHFKYPRATGDSIFIQLMYNMISANGSLITVIPTGFLWEGGIEKKIREDFILADVIEKIIYLPEKLFSNTSINTAILLINRNKQKINLGKIQFINLSDRVDLKKGKSISDIIDEFIENKKKWGIESSYSKVVDINETKFFDFDLNPNRYLNKDYDLALRITKSESKKQVKIREVLIDYFSNKSMNIHKWDRNKNVAYIHMNALSDSQLNFGLDFNKISNFSTLYEGTRLIKNQSILIALVGKQLKPTYIDPNNSPYRGRERMHFSVSQSILVLELDLDQILPEYLIYQLYNKSVLAQINGIRLGSGMPFIRISDFLSVKIELSAIAEQKVFIENFKNIFQEQIDSTRNKYESRVEDAIEKAYQAAGVMKHNLGQKLGILINDFETIKKFIEKKVTDKSDMDLNEKVVPVFEGEDPKAIESISLILNRFYKNLQDSRESLERGKNLFQLGKKDLKFEIVNLKIFLKKNVLPRYSNSSIFTIKVSGKSLNVNIDKHYFVDVIDNIIENAITHGFKDMKKKYKIIFEIREDEDSEGKYAKIKYSNTGDRFPEGFDLNQFKILGSSAGKTAGTGQGGFYINEVIKKHGGKLDNFSNFPQVSFEIILPLSEEN